MVSIRITSYNLCKATIQLMKYYIVFLAHVIEVGKDNWCSYIICTDYSDDVSVKWAGQDMFTY